MIVVDTNLLVYLYVPSRDTSLAEAVLSRDPIWISTPLWLSEFRNVLAGFIREGALTVEGGKRIAARAESWMRGREHAVSSDRVLELAATSGCTAYDCQFIALAVGAAISLVTLDKQILRAFPEIALSPTAFLA
jgi:predicted nucleic acid-binding protein